MAKSTNNLMDNEDTEIYSDWQIVKFNIWKSWGSLLVQFADLTKYKMQGIKPEQSRGYIKCCTALVQTYLTIGASRYKKHFKTKKGDKNQHPKVTQLKSIYEKSLKGDKPTFKEIADFIELTDEWLDISGMGNIDMNIDDPGKAVLH